VILNTIKFSSVSASVRSLTTGLRRITTIDFLRLFFAAAISLVIWIMLVSRGHPGSYFSTRCIDYRQKDLNRQLNDRIVDYSAEAKLKGVSTSRNNKEFRNKISAGSLVKVRSGAMYIVERMTYSYPAVTADSKILLDEIARRFSIKTSRKGLYGAKFYITSMTRKTDDLKNLRRYNSNSSENSPHLYGNAFDISYKRFSVRKLVLTNCDMKFLKDALAEVIWQLREENKCWATYERMQNCFHVVAR
jgi:hypothetical protein